MLVCQTRLRWTVRTVHLTNVVVDLGATAAGRGWWDGELQGVQGDGLVICDLRRALRSIKSRFDVGPYGHFWLRALRRVR